MAKQCDSCNTAPAAVFCRSHSTFLCPTCDADLHAPPTRHPRVGLCDVCEQSPAAVTCKADAAALCSACDADIHSANPLARRHHRLPVLPFYHAAAAAAADDFSDEEAEAASWILPDPNSKPDLKSGPPFDMDPVRAELKQASTDGVVPGEDNGEYESGQYPGRVAVGFPAYEVEYSGSKPFMYNFTASQSISQSVSSPSFEVGVVPDHNAMADTSKNVVVPCRAVGVDREARVLRYKEKRKNRMFKKTIRYASRKAYAETRPRIKGRFAKRSELEASNYVVVPSF